MLMRAAAFLVDLTLFRKPRTSQHSSKALGGTIGRGKSNCRRRDRKRSYSAPVMVFRAILEFIRRVICHIFGLAKLGYRKVAAYQPVRYYNCPLSPLTGTRLYSVRRKIMVLDLDETLIHSHHDGVISPVTPTVPPDFIIRVRIENRPVRFFVHKRPHVDFFLSMISQWYELVIFTASMEMYGMAVANRLDNDKKIFQRRFFRQHCTMDLNGYTKNLATICSDLSSVFILDNSPAAYRGNPDNAIPIKSWFSDARDTALLDLLPLLDALRFTNDVRSVLSRNLHSHSLW